MRKNYTRLLRYCFALLLSIGVQLSYAQGVIQGEKYLFNDFSFDPLSDTSWTVSGSNGGSAAAGSGTLDLTLTAVPSYNIFYTMEFDNTVNLSENGNLEISCKGALTNCDTCVFKLFFILEDENGNQTGDNWRVQEDVPTEFTKFTKELSHPDVPQDNVDFSKIKKLHIRNQSHDGAWGNVDADGSLMIDYIKLGDAPAAKATKTYFREDFIGSSLTNDLYDVNLSRGATEANVTNGNLKVDFTETTGWEAFLDIDLKDSINLTNNANMEVRLKVDLACAENAVDCRIQVRLADVNGNTTGDAWQVYVSKKQEGYQVLDFNWLDNPDGADLTQIKKIVIRSASRDENWGGVNMSGSVTIDYIRVGEESVGPIEVPKNGESKYFATPITIDGSIDEAWGLTNKYQVANSINLGATEAPTAEDISAAFHTGWDLDYFYLFAMIKDDKDSSAAGTDLHMFDNLEVFLNPNLANDNLNGVYGDDAMQIRFNRKNEGISGQNVPAAEDVVFSQVETDTGWVVEAKIKWSGILPDGMTLPEGMEMGFELSVSDRDEGDTRDHVIAWNNDSGEDKAWSDTRYFGILKVKERIIKDPRTVAIQGKPNAAPTIDGDGSDDVWADVNEVAIDRVVPKLTGETTGEGDFSASYKTFYNSENLFIYVDVTDDVLVKYEGTSDTYRFDYIEIYVNPSYANDDAETGGYADDAMQIRFNLGNPETTSGSGKQPGEGQWQVAFTESATGYTAEIRLAWAGIFLSDMTLSPPMEFGFDVIVADNDGALDGGNPQRDMLLSWNNDSKKDNSHFSTLYFGTAALQEMTLTPVTNTVTAVSATEVTVGFSPALAGLTKDDMKFFSPSGLLLSLKSVATTDEGASYTIKPNINLVPGSEYKFIANSFGYEFDTLTVKMAPLLANENELVGISVYPNPVQEALTISANGVSEVSIINLSGVTLRKQSGIDKFGVQVADLPKGIYFISIKNEGSTQTTRFIKQ